MSGICTRIPCSPSEMGKKGWHLIECLGLVKHDEGDKFGHLFFQNDVHTFSKQASLYPQRVIGKQDMEKLTAYATAMKDKHLFLNKFDSDWPSREFLKQYHSYLCKCNRNPKFTSECYQKYHGCQHHDDGSEAANDD
ncbi:hypothetical protein BS47DRAFT_1348105 [Hydnum rufescens UP504]|uniref:Uncharacterized protein n=1 Tax=Hydnum rufescens UP504 TaxID=1448309 RepID=A0A9P6AR17_9AGAM|nr:hypothetical protein BS47DRAFT_1348105 [Hydnum rufescens UP504]